MTLFFRLKYVYQCLITPENCFLYLHATKDEILCDELHLLGTTNIRKKTDFPITYIILIFVIVELQTILHIWQNHNS
jgi:hypothetical protein